MYNTFTIQLKISRDTQPTMNINTAYGMNSLYNIFDLANINNVAYTVFLEKRFLRDMVMYNQYCWIIHIIMFWIITVNAQSWHSDLLNMLLI